MYSFVMVPVSCQILHHISKCKFRNIFLLKHSSPRFSHTIASSDHVQEARAQEARLCVVGTGGNEVSPTLCLISGKQHYWFNCGEGTTRVLSMHNFGRGVPLALLTQVSWTNFAGLTSLYPWYMVNAHMREPLKYMSPRKHKEMVAAIMSITCGNDTSESIGYIDDPLFSISPIELGTDAGLVAYLCKLQDKNSESLSENASSNSFIVLECPHECYINTICAHRNLNALWLKEQNQPVDFIVHITPLNILQTNKYCKWMSSFGPDVHHLLLHSSVCPSETSWRDSLGISMAFHLMNPQVFHVPIQKKDNLILWSNLKLHHYLRQEQVTVGCAGLQCHMKKGQRATFNFSNQLSPLKEFMKSTHQKAKECCGPSIALYHQNVSCIKEMKSTYDFEGVTSYPNTLTKSEDVMVTFLGTGATRNSNFRNVTSILLQTAHNGNIMLDCGEATITQLEKCFGREKSYKILSNLHTIFLSHLHPDHWTGIFSLLHKIQAIHRTTMSTPFSPVTIIAPPNIVSVLEVYHSFSDINCDIINSYHTEKVPYLHNSLIMKTFPVQHVRHSFGIKVFGGGKDDWSVVYSGDTSPCARVLEEGKNASLLIHEGTYSGRKNVRDHVVKRHSFYHEVTNAVIACNAKFSAITHFSTAEPLFPLMEPNVQSVVPAMDFMSLNIPNIVHHGLDSDEAAHVFHSIKAFSKFLRD